MRHPSTRTFFFIISIAIGLIGMTFPAIAAEASSKVEQLNQTDIPQPQPGIFTPAPCWTTIPPQMMERVSCGYVSVPERHAHPEGAQINLAVMIIKAGEENSRADPLFFLQGGPGGSTIDTYADILLTVRPSFSNRDIILFDQRGALFSQPSLVCDEYNDLLLETIEKDIPDEEYLEKEAGVFRACRKRLINQGIDLSAYNSLENSADIQSIRQALGYDQINLYGVSYGTLLALHTMRFFPENLRSVVLDAVVPPQTNFLTEVPQTAQRAFNYLFESCSNDVDCEKAYPNLENRFYNLVETLNQNPLRIPLTDPDNGTTYQAILDGDTFLDGMFQFLYIGDFLPAIPKIIVDAENGEFDLFARIFSLLVFDRTYSYGMYFSVLCSEDADFSPDQVSFEGVHPELAESQAGDASQFLKTCELWQVEALNSIMDEPVSSQIPVLILSGGFDPITPPENGLEAAKTLPNSFVVEFPTGGHGAALDGDCQDQIIQSFLDAPDQAPDTSCVEPIEKMGFYTHKTVIQIPAAIELLNLENNRGNQFLILMSAALLLFPSIFFVPSRELWKAYRGSQTKTEIPDSQTTATTSVAENFSNQYSPPSFDVKHKQTWFGWLISSPHWLYWFYSLVTWLFLLSFFTILGLMLVENDTRLYYGLPGQARFLFWLPPIMLITFFLLGFALVKKWFAPQQGILSKLGLTVVFLVCLVILIILGQWGILLALF